MSLTHTTVANTLLLLASAPLLSAVLGRMLLGERVRRATWVTMASRTVSIRCGALTLAMGALQISVGLVLFTVGSRQLPAAELTLLSLTEVILGPVWVWLGSRDTPTLATLVGGFVLLETIASQALLGRRRFPPPIGDA